VKGRKEVRGPLWLETRDLLAIHDRLAALHGGARGVRDLGLLESALGRPRQHYAYTDPPDFIEMAALYTVGIVRNHPFVDGNKRAGFVAGVLFLEMNGFNFQAFEEDAARTVLDLAASKLTESEYSAWLRANTKRQR